MWYSQFKSFKDIAFEQINVGIIKEKKEEEEA